MPRNQVAPKRVSGDLEGNETVWILQCLGFSFQRLLLQSRIKEIALSFFFGVKFLSYLSISSFKPSCEVLGQSSSQISGNFIEKPKKNPLSQLQLGSFQWGLQSLLEQWKRAPGCLGYIGDEMLYVGYYFINHKDPYEKQPVWLHGRYPGPIFPGRRSMTRQHTSCTSDEFFI